MRGIKNLAWMSIATMLILAMSGIVMASPPPWERSAPLIYIDHWLNSAEPGETFTVYITAKGVTDLFVADMRIAFDFSVLEVVGISPGNTDPYLEVIWFERVDIKGTTWSEVIVASGRELEVRDGLSGEVQLACVTFLVKAKTDRSIITIFSSDLRNTDDPGSDPERPQNTIQHNTNDAVLENVYPTLTIRNFVKPQLAGATSTLETTVTNSGEEAANVRVKFKVTDPTGAITPVTSDPIEIGPGDKESITATYDVPQIPGYYVVQGEIEYEWVPFRWISWEDVESAFGGEGTSKDVPGKGVARFEVV